MMLSLASMQFEVAPLAPNNSDGSSWIIPQRLSEPFLENILNLRDNLPLEPGVNTNLVHVSTKS